MMKSSQEPQVPDVPPDGLLAPLHERGFGQQFRFSLDSRVLLFFVSSLLILDRIRLLTTFAFRYTDEDQTLLWYAASEAWHGRFHEPCFYGQAYNSTLEAILSLPLYTVGIALPYAVPTTTCLLGVLPYFMLAWLAWRKELPRTAAIILLIPLVLPLPYAMVTAIPRGFVTGLAVGVFAGIYFVTAKSIWGWFTAGLLSILALTLNPNVAVLLLTVGVYAWLGNFTRLRFYAGLLFGMMIGALVPTGIYLFYRSHPNYDLHEHKPLAFDWMLWHQGMNDLNTFFGHFVPVVSHGWIALAVLAIFPVVLLIVGQYRGAVGVLAAGVLCVLSLGINRIHEGSGSVFLSASRMYLAVPVVWALALLWIGEGSSRWRVSPIVRWACALVLVGLCVLVLIPRHWQYVATIRAMMRDRRLDVWNVAELEASARVIEAIARSQHVPVILFPTDRGKALNYALPALTSGACETLFPHYERRTWRLEEEARTIRPKILVYIDDAPRLFLFAKDLFPDATLVSESPQVMCIDPGGKSMIDVAKIFDVRVRKFQ
jgi:hypothetical protein